MTTKVSVKISKLGFVTSLKGKTATKKCLCIPIENAAIFEGKSGDIYLNLLVGERRDGADQFGKTHWVKLDLPKEAADKLTDDQKRELYIGSGKTLQPKPNDFVGENVIQAEYATSQQVGSIDDLPF